MKDVPIRRLPSDMVKYRWGWPLRAHLCLSLDYLSVCVNYVLIRKVEIDVYGRSSYCV